MAHSSNTPKRNNLRTRYDTCCCIISPLFGRRIEIISHLTFVRVRRLFLIFWIDDHVWHESDKRKWVSANLSVHRAPHTFKRITKISSFSTINWYSWQWIEKRKESDIGEWTGHVPRTNTNIHTQIAVIKYRFSSATWDWRNNWMRAKN